MTFSRIRETHEALYAEALSRLDDLRDESDFRSEFWGRLERLLASFNEYASTLKSLEEYLWITQAVVSWQVINNSVVFTQEPLHVTAPPKDLTPRVGRSYSDRELEDQRRRNAELLSGQRRERLGRESTEEEMAHDWYLAKTMLMSEILDGKINLASRIARAAFNLLESEWIDDIKRMRAYFVWIQQGRPGDTGHSDRHYFEVCRHLRSMLVNSSIKALASEFDEIQTYINTNYLTNGRLDDREKPGAMLLISRKAGRIKEMTGSTLDQNNWFNACNYARVFYENIIPAVTERKKDAILRVLQAFQYGPELHRANHVVNAFEVAIAVYFLDPEIIKELWLQSAQGSGQSSGEAIAAKCESWPREIAIPESVRGQLSVSGTDLRFVGVMTEEQRDVLRAQFDRGWECLDVIEALYLRSRRVFEHTTL